MLEHPRPLLTDLLAADPDLARRLDAVFGAPSDPMPEIERRAETLLAPRRAIVWEGNPETFQFTYVGRAARAVLGYPTERWTQEPDFWVGTIVHPEDRNDAVAFCALAAGQGRDHDFCYRAQRADGAVVWLHDVVRVIKGRFGLAQRLRGVMIELPGPPEGRDRE